MFKLTYQGFILMSLLGGWLVATSRPEVMGKRWLRYGISLAVILVTSASLLFPYFAFRDYYNRLDTFVGLDGLAWLRNEAPDEYAALGWLQKNVSGQPVILEGVGESYTKFARMSAFTGLPTVLGWRVHEWLWRGSFDIPGKRTEEVKTIYEKPLSRESLRYLDEYQVEYIVVGRQEDEAYQVHPEVSQLGSVVFESGGTKILKRSVSNASFE